MKNQNKIENALIDCAVACNASVNYFEVNDKEVPEEMLLHRNCADICNQAVKLIKQDSRILYKYLVITEDICRMVSEQATKYDDNEYCKECVEAAKKAAKLCRTYRKEKASPALEVA